MSAGRGYWYVLTEVDVRKRWALPTAPRDLGPRPPREPRPTAVTAARRAWRKEVCALLPRTQWATVDGQRRKVTVQRLERVKDMPPLKLAMRQAGFLKVRGRWIKST